ncbi:MAG: DUF624 domain-containing protein [Ruminococcaceae bacterium]|nr:DUF624 domain-containing protein [Oscillospiraceae bacterium]
MKKGFKLFDVSKPGKGVKKNSGANFTFLGFFKLLKRKFFDLSKVNFLWIVTNFPLFFGFVALSGNFNIPFSAPADPLYPILDGVSKFTNNPGFMALWGISGKNVEMTYAGPVAEVLYALTFLAIFTFGFANTGMAYVLRNHAREEYVDMPSDYFRTIKKNFFQALILGIIDIVFSAIIIYDLIFFRLQANLGFIYSMFFYFSIFLAILWVFMHFYMYQLLVTFKLSIFKILKNSFIFSLIGLKRNFVALISMALVIGLNVLIYVYFLPLGGLLPFFITVALVNFIGVYAAYPNIKKIMIDPYYKSDDHIENTPEEPSVFHDMG